MHIYTLLAFTFILWVNFCKASEHNPRTAQCQPLHIVFDQSASPSFNSHFTAISPEGSYALTDKGLEMNLYKPNGRVTTSAGVNDKIGDGATINSTFTLSAGKVTFQVSSPTVSGVIVAGILIGDTSLDEIDIEFVCGEPDSWQTNLFVADPRDSRPEYGVFSSKQKVDSVTKLHSYSIDINGEKITWSIDNMIVKTLAKNECTRNGFLHYPTHTMRVQLGIWDASSPAGTAEWGRGPVNWTGAPDKITATVKSVTVECD
ncbi:glycoside hydrolase family 16 protein [Mycena rosella]|uniref:Glycoside hydrolase family 16 protein n=1 Tax=Mycena rosella TaxID=1033263 RepID=A0AAD7CX81_MYCRO|nr:glycoside hydrolase family 16 protein [Mycena rosella]